MPHAWAAVHDSDSSLPYMWRDFDLTLQLLGLLPLLLVHAGTLAADAAGWSGRPLAGCASQ
jgi:hypothetical protein